MLMQNRLKAILTLEQRKIKYDIISKYPLDQLLVACDTLKQHDIPSSWYENEPQIMDELVGNPSSADLIAKLCKRGAKGFQLSNILSQVKSNGESITDYSCTRIMKTLCNKILRSDLIAVYLRHFSILRLSADENYRLTNNLNANYKSQFEIEELSDTEMKLLFEPYLSSDLIPHDEFRETLALLAENTDIRSIIELYHQNEVIAKFALSHYKAMQIDAGRINHSLKALFDLLGMDKDTIRDFTTRWRDNGCSYTDLEAMLRKLKYIDMQELNKAVKTKRGYINLLYGNVLSTELIAQMNPWAEDILLYALSHKKTRFLKLIEENVELYNTLDRYSILFEEKLYTVLVNLNTLSRKDIADCGSELFSNSLEWDIDALGDRSYTFPEIKALYGHKQQYIDLYCALKNPKVDEKLLVLRQLTKRELLDNWEDDSSIPDIAERLSEKPLMKWVQEDFRHIKDITPHGALKLLAKYKSLYGYLAEINSADDLELAVRNIEQLWACGGIETFKKRLIECDVSWSSLAQTLNLHPDLVTKNIDNIIRFLAKDGAGISLTYMKKITKEQEEAFIRIIKAELLGQFHLLKYHPEDLRKEISFLIDDMFQATWARAISHSVDEITVCEKDDFFSTLLMGVQPQRTCLSYINGEYAECLLAGFDTNKKILQATMHGQVVGRAIIRVTKGRFTLANDSASLQFADVESMLIEQNTSDNKKDKKTSDSLILFLEKSYLGGISPAIQKKVRSAFIHLAEEKANQMKCMLVISTDYTRDVSDEYALTSFHVYISQSKAGNQYMDSYGGSAEKSSEKGYRSDSFFIKTDAL